MTDEDEKKTYITLTIIIVITFTVGFLVGWGVSRITGW